MSILVATVVFRSARVAKTNISYKLLHKLVQRNTVKQPPYLYYNIKPYSATCLQRCECIHVYKNKLLT